MSDVPSFEEIVELWIRNFIDSMDEGPLSIGDRSGEEPPGIKVIFDGYGYNEETNTEDDEEILTFALFVHKDSVSGEFPDHKIISGSIVHRPKEEVCIRVIYDAREDYVTVLPFEESEATELDPELIYKTVSEIYLEYYA